jgi:hypothetical protein
MHRLYTNTLYRVFVTGEVTISALVTLEIQGRVGGGI